MFVSHLFFSNAPPPTEIYTLSLHDALPIWHLWIYLRLAFGCVLGRDADQDARQRQRQSRGDGVRIRRRGDPQRSAQDRKSTRLNSSHLGISYAVFCLKKKKKTKRNDLSVKS